MANITQDLGSIDLVSISAYRKLDGDIPWDQDMTPLPLVAAKFVPSLKTFSQEFHLRSHSTSPVERLVVALYFYSNGGYDHIMIVGRFQDFVVVKTKSNTCFGQAPFNHLQKPRNPRSL